MFGSKERRRREEFAAWAQKNADDHRKQTEAGIKTAHQGPNGRVDRDFIRNWKPGRDADQEYLDREARDAAKRAKRWWQ
jgi:hypothetical protein